MMRMRSAATSAATSSATGGGSAALGSPNPAKGTPVTFGMINVETNAGADFPEVRESAQAAINYVNQYRGGLNGHPIKLITCIADGQPATSASCANKLVNAHPVADIGTYAVQNLHAKKVAVIAIGDTQGIFQAQHGELPGVKGAGGQAKLFPLPPSQADASSVVSSALAYSPDVVEIESPSQCVAILSALKSLDHMEADVRPEL